MKKTRNVRKWYPTESKQDDTFIADKRVAEMLREILYEMEVGKSIKISGDGVHQFLLRVIALYSTDKRFKVESMEGDYVLLYRVK